MNRKRGAMLSKLRQSQSEYLELLKKVKDDLDLENVTYNLDKVRNFWFRKQKLLEMCSQYLFNNSDTYFYTAVSKFNVANQIRTSSLHWEIIKYLTIQYYPI